MANMFLLILALKIYKTKSKFVFNLIRQLLARIALTMNNNYQIIINAEFERRFKAISEKTPLNSCLFLKTV